MERSSIAHRVTLIDGMAVSPDGTRVRLTIHTASATPFSIEVLAEDMTGLLGSFLSLAQAAGAAQKRPPDPERRALPLPGLRVAAHASEAGEALLVLDAGPACFEVALSPSDAKGLGSSLLMLSATPTPGSAAPPASPGQKH